VGFRLDEDLYEAGATLIHQEYGDPYPRMSWPTNYARLACATLFTLFFSGNDYAPKTRIDGIPAQDYLQGHYIRAMREVAKALKDESNVLGFDTLNEPSNGYVGLDDLRLSVFPIPLAHHMSAFDGMILGAGFPRRIDLFTLPFIFNHTVLMNPRGISAWQSPDKDVWKANGVWDIGPDGQPRLLRPKHFELAPGKDFLHEYMLPFFINFSHAIREVAPDMMIFGEPHIEPRRPVHQHAPAKELRDQVGGSIAWVPHFYDGATLMTKAYHTWLAVDAERSMIAVGPYFANHVFKRAAVGLRRCGSGLPVLVGETGVPMDMGSSFSTGDFSLQAHALNRLLGAMEKEFLSWTLWTYTPDNNNERGDLWNGEDLALWSKDQMRDPTDLNSGGRALESAVRPYPMRLAGSPLETSFDPFSERRRFFLKVRLLVADREKGLETVLFIPKLQYPKGIDWHVGGKGSSMMRVLNSSTSTNEQGYLWRHDVTPGATSVDEDEVFVDQWIEIEARL
jgi:hypothetical protein